MTTHETIQHEENFEVGSDRSFGLVVGGILSAIGLYQLFVGHSSWYLWFLTPGAALVTLGLIVPSVLRPLNILWLKFGLLLGRVVTPVVMFLIFIIAFVPIGLLLRLFGKDLLALKLEDDIDSFWIVRSPPGPAPESLRDQF